MSAADFDYDSLETGYYDKIYRRSGAIRRFWHHYKFKAIESLIVSSSQSRILDIGCAAGSFLGHLRKPCLDKTGVDIARKQIEYANQKYGNSRCHFIAGDIRQLPLERESFDIVVLSEIIEHISKSQGGCFIARIHELLKPGGKLILTTPNYKSLWPIIEFLLNRFAEVSHELQHINPLNLRTIDLLLRENKLYPVDKGTFFILSPFIAGLSWKAAKRLMEFERAHLRYLGSILYVVAEKR